jgi:GNAT superfamily N-acetyltransferase
MHVQRRQSLTPDKTATLDLEFYPLIADRWTDLEKLFGKNGACGGCWCMWWRLKRSDFDKMKGEENRLAFKRIVDSGKVPGILAYADGQPIAWCAVAPREAFTALRHSRTLKRVDDKPVWAVPCFFTAKSFRGKGIMSKLLKAALDYVQRQGGIIVEAYPIETKKGKIPDAFAYTGLASTFRKAGFVQVHRPSERRVIMRYFLKKE